MDGPRVRRGLFIKVFKDTQSTRKAMASFDSLETLLPELGDMDAVSLARAALDRQQHGMGRVASECNYIEAQVHGPIVFARAPDGLPRRQRGNHRHPVLSERRYGGPVAAASQRQGHDRHTQGSPPDARTGQHAGAGHELRHKHAHACDARRTAGCRARLHDADSREFPYQKNDKSSSDFCL